MWLLIQLWAYGGSMAGVWYSGKKSLLGPLISGLGFIPWSLLALHGGLPLMVAYNSINAALNVRAFILWRRSQKQAAQEP